VLFRSRLCANLDRFKGFSYIEVATSLYSVRFGIRLCTSSREMLASCTSAKSGCGQSLNSCRRWTELNEPGIARDSLWGSKCWNSARTEHWSDHIPDDIYFDYKYIFYRQSYYSSTWCPLFNVCTRLVALKPPIAPVHSLFDLEYQEVSSCPTHKEVYTRLIQGIRCAWPGGKSNRCAVFTCAT
jgi:hypothetical protein